MFMVPEEPKVMWCFILHFFFYFYFRFSDLLSSTSKRPKYAHLYSPVDEPLLIQQLSSGSKLWLKCNRCTPITFRASACIQTNKASRHSSYTSFIVAHTNLFSTCMKNTKGKAPSYLVIMSQISTKTSWQTGAFHRCLNISKQSLRFVSYTLTLKHTNMRCKTMLFKVSWI